LRELSEEVDEQPFDGHPVDAKEVVVEEKELTVSELVRQSYALAKEKGWHEGRLDIPEKLCLVHSEISEALEAFRTKDMAVRIGENGKPEGFPIELADTVIRIADLCGALGINLAEAIAIKHAYNATRSYRHGGKAA
jgi:hypothetical protein